MEDGLHVQREEVHLSTVTLILYVRTCILYVHKNTVIVSSAYTLCVCNYYLRTLSL